MKQGIQDSQSKCVSVPADKAANYVVVVCRLHFVNILKQDFYGTRAYQETGADEISIDNAHFNELQVLKDFPSVCVNEGQHKLPTIYWLHNLHQKLDLLQILVLVLPLNFPRGESLTRQ